MTAEGGSGGMAAAAKAVSEGRYTDALESAAYAIENAAGVYNIGKGFAATVKVKVPNGLRTVQESGLTEAQARRIQNAADKTGQRITVVGSRAGGTHNPASDFDYIASGASKARGKAKNSVPRGNYGGENNSGIDWWQDYNPNAPNYNPLDPSRPHVIFDPK